MIKTLRSLLKKPVFLAGNADWLAELPSVIKKHHNTIHNSVKMAPIQASRKSNEKKMSIPIFKIEESDRNQNLN